MTRSESMCWVRQVWAEAEAWLLGSDAPAAWRRSKPSSPTRVFSMPSLQHNLEWKTHGMRSISLFGTETAKAAKMGRNVNQLMLLSLSLILMNNRVWVWIDALTWWEGRTCHGQGGVLKWGGIEVRYERQGQERLPNHHHRRCCHCASSSHQAHVKKALPFTHSSGADVFKSGLDRWFVREENYSVFVYYYVFHRSRYIAFWNYLTTPLCITLQKTYNAILWTHNSNVSSKCGGECDEDEVRQSEAPGKASLGTNSTCTWYLGVLLEGPLRPCAPGGRGGETFCAPSIRTVRWPGCLQ